MRLTNPARGGPPATAASAPLEIAALEAQLRSGLRGQVSDLSLQARDGGLVLRGRSRTYYAKQLAQHGVMRSSRLPVLANEIEVG